MTDPSPHAATSSRPSAGTPPGPDPGPEPGPVPGPGGLELLGLLRPARRNPLRLFPELTERHGDLVCLSRRGRVYLASHPDHVKHVLQDNHAAYHHNVRQRLAMGRESLALAEGEDWRRQRRLMQPLFNRQRMADRLAGMEEILDPHLDRWIASGEAAGRPDVARAMVEITLDLLIDLLLGVRPGDPEHPELAGSVRTAFEFFNDRQTGRLPSLPFLARRRRRRLGASLRAMQEAVRRHVERRRRGETGGSDLLSGFLAREDHQDGSVMSDRQILDEVMMLLVMGHMTTAMGLTWTLHLLATHPQTAAAALAEIDALDGGPPTPADLERLEALRRAIEESLRLYPPSWRFSRRAVEADAIGGYPIATGSLVVLCPWVTHRRSDLWTEPTRFDPDRFLDQRSAGRPRLAYYPFGGGPRSCIARELALMEMPLVIARVLQRFRLEPLADREVEPVPAITLQPRGGLPMVATRRDGQRSRAAERAAAASRRSAAAPEPDGTAAGGSDAPSTLADLALAAFARDLPDALLERRDGAWHTVPTRELEERTARLVTAFEELGLAVGDTVAVRSAGSADATAVELACWICGLRSMTLDPRLGAEETADRCRRADALLISEDGGPEGADRKLTDLLAADPATDLAGRAARRRPDEPAVAAWSAGTTGEPRLATLDHEHLVAAVHGVAELLPPLASGRGPAYAALPASDPVQRTVTAACLLHGVPLAFAGRPGGGDDDRGPERELDELRPQLVSASPELFAWVMERIYGWAHEKGVLRDRLFRWAVGVGRRAAPARMAGGRPGGLALRLADRLVHSKLRALLGGRVEAAMVSGPLTAGWTGFLWALDIPVLVAYGVAEAAAPLTLARPGAVRPGTAGHPLPGVEVRLTGDGEILARGPSVPVGDRDGGWLATGDRGEIDPEGRITVFGPKEQEIPAGPGGETFHPGPAETAFAAGHFFRRALVVPGPEDRPAALLEPDVATLRRWARRRGLPDEVADGDAETLLRHPRVEELVAREVRSINGLLPEARRLVLFRLLPDGFSRSDGELTARGGVRRHVVAESRAEELRALREGEGAEPASPR